MSHKKQVKTKAEHNRQAKIKRDNSEAQAYAKEAAPSIIAEAVLEHGDTLRLVLLADIEKASKKADKLRQAAEIPTREIRDQDADEQREGLTKGHAPRLRATLTAGEGVTISQGLALKAEGIRRNTPAAGILLTVMDAAVMLGLVLPDNHMPAQLQKHGTDGKAPGDTVTVPVTPETRHAFLIYGDSYGLAVSTFERLLAVCKANPRALRKVAAELCTDQSEPGTTIRHNCRHTCERQLARVIAPENPAEYKGRSLLALVRRSIAQQDKRQRALVLELFQEAVPDDELADGGVSELGKVGQLTLFERDTPGVLVPRVQMLDAKEIPWLAVPLFFELNSAVDISERTPGRAITITPTLREVISWVWPAGWNRTNQLPQLAKALEYLHRARWEIGDWRWSLISVERTPTKHTALDEVIPIRILTPEGAAGGVQYQRDIMRALSPHKKAYTVGLRLAYMWDKANQKAGIPKSGRIYSDRPALRHGTDNAGAILGADGKPIKGRRGQVIKNRYSPEARPYWQGREPNPKAERVPLLEQYHLAELAYGATDKKLSAPTMRQRIHRGREALAEAVSQGLATVLDEDMRPVDVLTHRYAFRIVENIPKRGR